MPLAAMVAMCCTFFMQQAGVVKSSAPATGVSMLTHSNSATNMPEIRRIAGLGYCTRNKRDMPFFPIQISGLGWNEPGAPLSSAYSLGAWARFPAR